MFRIEPMVVIALLYISGVWHIAVGVYILLTMK
jgi:hypothetical protein